jgi:hypothetical protein
MLSLCLNTPTRFPDDNVHDSSAMSPQPPGTRVRTRWPGVSQRGAGQPARTGLGFETASHKRGLSNKLFSRK